MGVEYGGAIDGWSGYGSIGVGVRVWSRGGGWVGWSATGVNSKVTQNSGGFAQPKVDA